MALYNLSNPLDCENFRVRADGMLRKGCIVELTEKKPVRTGRQNRYLHVILGYFGSHLGLTIEEVKRDYFKIECNGELFIRQKYDRILGRDRKYLRSSSELDTSEMTLAIDRFRDFASQRAGLYIPSPEEHDKILLMEIEIERNRRFL